MEKKDVTDEMCIAKWRQLLRMFKKLIEGNPTPEIIKEDLIALKQTASLSIELTPRQVEGIVARCDNYLNGEYGNTKTAGNLSYGATTPEVTKAQSNGKQ